MPATEASFPTGRPNPFDAVSRAEGANPQLEIALNITARLARPFGKMSSFGTDAWAGYVEVMPCTCTLLLMLSAVSTSNKGCVNIS